MRLKDKSIIVTGATSGIGAAIATAIVREGGKVLVHGINREEGEELVSRLGKSAALCIEDITGAGSPERIVASALSAFGKVDGLVNNAARFDRGTLAEIDSESFDATMAVNLKAALFMAKAAYAELKTNKGVVLNIGSINALAGESTLLAYSISKGGMQTMTRNLANAHGIHGIRFNQINPGWILTENENLRQLNNGLEPGWSDRLSKMEAPFGHMSTPQSVAEAAIYWLSSDSYPFTGSVVELEQFSMVGRNPEKL